uniref:Creatininase n=1 Tax=Thermosporothrix sp. COM3 TaxID=2490863 RepID=A0A455SI28_9CHLR|nr:creatininase [Thermosporothrix sp. COM3]
MDVKLLHGRDVKRVVEEVNFAVVPLGSIEYHGPHSPLGTDYLLAEGFAQRIAPELKPLVFPVVPYAACPGKTQGYPGTIAIPPEAYHAYLAALLRGICQMGLRRILLLNAHDGNMGVSRTVAEQITGEWRDASFLLVNWWQMVSHAETEEMGVFEGTTGRGHGGPYEMSAVKGLHPELVHVTAEDEELPSPAPLSSLPYILVEGTPRGWNGYTGLIQQTSLATGQKLVERVTQNLHALLNSWLQNTQIEKK